MNFISSPELPKKTGDDNLCLVWVYDTESEIGYCWPQLCYLDEDGVWIPDDLNGYVEPLETDGLTVTAWAYVPKPRRARRPRAEK